MNQFRKSIITGMLAFTVAIALAATAGAPEAHAKKGAGKGLLKSLGKGLKGKGLKGEKKGSGKGLKKLFAKKAKGEGAGEKRGLLKKIGALGKKGLTAAKEKVQDDPEKAVGGVMAAGALVKTQVDQSREPAGNAGAAAGNPSSAAPAAQAPAYNPWGHHRGNGYQH